MAKAIRFGLRGVGLALALANATGLAVAQTAAAELPRWVLDAERSFVHWELLHFNTSTMRGRFGPVQGELRYDPRSGRGSLGLVIDTTTQSTGLAIFDARIRRDDLLDTAAFPQAFFSVGSFRLQPGNPGPQELRGEFTLKGQSAPLALRTIRFACRSASTAGPEVCGGDFEARFERSAFGISFGLPFVADTVRLLVQVEARRVE
jgi:polyisoprenoid-binding protein YceI